MEIFAKCDQHLLTLLQKTEKKHVDFLVYVLTDDGSGRIALSSSIKDLLLHELHKEDKYSKKTLCHLLHEFQKFGGHSFVNLFRDEPLPYADILTDVHKKLNGEDSKTKSREQKEREVVLGLFGAGWRSLADQTRRERSTEIKVISGFFNLKENLNFDAAGLATGLSVAASAAVFVASRMHPAAAAFSSLGVISQSVGEAYRMTIPFVAQIAYIKMLSQLHINK